MGDAIKSIGKRGLRYLDNNRILKRIGEWLGDNIISPMLDVVGDLTAPIVNRIKNAIRRKLDEAQEIARQLGEGVDNVIDDVTGRPQLATEGAGGVNSSRIEDNQSRSNEPSRMEGNQTGGSSFKRGLNSLSKSSKQTVRNWDTEVQIRISNLLNEGDPIIREVVDRVIQQSSDDPLTKVNRLLDAMSNKPRVPDNFSRGEFFARGGTSELFEMQGNPDLLIKPGGGRLPNEARAMVEMEMIGIPTVFVKKTTEGSENVLILQKIDGVGSKDIIGRQRNPLNPPENTEVVTQKTIDDLEEIYRKLQANQANIGDFQFIIRRSDGAVIVNDPVSFTRRRNGPRGDIRSIIDRFRKIMRDRGEN